MAIDVPEAASYRLSMRATSPEGGAVCLYTGHREFRVEKTLSFDDHAREGCGMTYFWGSFLASVLLAVRQDAEDGVRVEDIEGCIDVEIASPLSLVGVRGYEEDAGISRVRIRIYVYAEFEADDLSEEAMQARLRERIRRDPLYTMLLRAIPVEVDLQCIP